MVRLSIGKTIVTLLSTVTELTKLSPVVLVEGAKYPYAAYKRSGTDCNESKDRGAGINTAIMEIAVVDDNYDRSLTVAQKVIDAVAGKRGTYGDINLIDIRIDNASEEYQNDAYIQSITLTVKYS